jgi:hypothetical protein
MRQLLAWASLVVAGSTIAQGQTAHVHGAAQMSVALIDSALEIALYAPAESFWGFEHAAKSTEEIAAEQKALATLKSGSWLVLPSSAGCTLVTSSAARSDGGADDAEHRHGHEHVSEASSAHTNVEVNLQFTCTQADDLTQPNAIELRLFATFASLNTVDLQGITDTKQLAKRLTNQDFKFGL